MRSLPAIVVDANVAILAILPVVQSRPDVLALFGMWHGDGNRLCAPDLWPVEVTSAVRRYVHSGHCYRRCFRSGG